MRRKEKQDQEPRVAIIKFRGHPIGRRKMPLKAERTNRRIAALAAACDYEAARRSRSVKDVIAAIDV